MTDLKKLSEEFYLRDTLTVARELIGKYIVRVKDGVPLTLKITETEAYIGMIDKACHAYNGKRTQRTEALFLKGGHAYVYLIYGMYYCMNVVTEQKEVPCAVLIRGCSLTENSSLDDLNNLSLMRYGKEYNELSSYQLKNFANGPGKLCKALGITKELNKVSLFGDLLYISLGETVDHKNIKVGKRINIDYAEEAKDFLWRFYI